MFRHIMRALGHTTWLRFGLRDRIIRLTHNPDTCSPEEFTALLNGLVYRGDFATFIDWSVFYYGAYAREELMLLDDFLSTIETATFLDVGANIGHHTLFAATKARRVVAFEPFDDVSAKIEQKINDNMLSHVLLIRSALGTENNLAAYTKPKGSNTGTGYFSTTSAGCDTLQLPIRIGDEVLEEVGIGEVHFIKIDTEGFEPFVLAGLRNTLTRYRPLVFFEWTQAHRNMSVQDCQQLLPDGYSFYQFIAETVVFRLFRKQQYRLVRLPSTWADGNVLALPNEYIGRLATTSPRCNAARQLAAAG